MPPRLPPEARQAYLEHRRSGHSIKAAAMKAGVGYTWAKTLEAKVRTGEPCPLCGHEGPRRGARNRPHRPGTG